MADNSTTLQLAHDLTLAWLSNPRTMADADQVAAFLSDMAKSVNSLSSPTVEMPAAPTYEPAVSVRKSLANRDVIISMIDGRPYRSLKRHLSANGLDPVSYRERYGLKDDYPMVAPGYSEARRETAVRLGLGRKATKVVEAVVESAPVKKARKGISDAKKAAKAHLGG